MRRFMKFSHRIALATALMGPITACGKDEPKPAAADVAAEPPKPEPAKPEAPKAVEPEVKPAEVAPATAGAPQRERMKLGSIATLPEDVIAVGGVASLGKLVTAFADQAKQVPGLEVPSDPLKMALEGIKGQLGVDLAWLDPEQPVAFAVPNPKKYPDGFIVLLPVKREASLDLSKWPGAEVNAEGHDAFVDMGGRTFFLNELEASANRGSPPRRLVMTSHPFLYRDLESFVTDLAYWVPGEAIVLDTSVENATRIFGAELGDAKKSLAEMASMLSAGDQAATVSQAADLGFAFVEGTSRMSIGLDPTGDFPRLGLSFVGKPDSPVSKLAAQANGKKVGFAAAIPPEAWLAIGYDIDGAPYTKSAEESLKKLFDMPNPFFASFTEDDKKDLLGKFEKLSELQGSQSVTWLRIDGTRPFILEGLSDAKDGPALMQGMLDVADVFYRKGWSMARTDLVNGGKFTADQAPENLDFRGFLKLANTLTSAFGVSLDVREAKSKAGGSALGFEVSLQSDKLPPDNEIKLAMSLFGERLGLGIASESKLLSYAFSADPAARAAAILDQGVPASSTDAWLQAAGNSAMFMVVRPARILKALAETVPDLASNKAFFDGLADEPLVLSGASDGQAVSFELTLSAKQMKALATLP